MPQLADILTDHNVKLSQEQRDAIEAVLQDSASILVFVDQWGYGNDYWDEHDDIQIPFHNEIEEQGGNLLDLRLLVQYRGSDSMCNLGHWNESFTMDMNSPIMWILGGPNLLGADK